MRGEFVEVGGARLYYYAAGTRSGAEPVIFLHGFPASSHLWRDLVPQIPAGHRLVVCDLLGYGRSDRPGAHDLSIAAHAARVVGLMDALRIPAAAIVGHDLGGAIAQQLAVRHATRVARLALISSAAFDAWPPRELKMAKAALPMARRMPVKPVLNALRRALRHAYEEEEHGAHSVDMYLRPFEAPVGRDALIAHVAAMDPAETVALAGALEGIAVPTAVIWGEDDPFFPVSVAHRLQRAIPGATCDVLSGVKHFAPETAPETVGELLAGWLAR